MTSDLAMIRRSPRRRALHYAADVLRSLPRGRDRMSAAADLLRALHDAPYGHARQRAVLAALGIPVPTYWEAETWTALSRLLSGAHRLLRVAMRSEGPSVTALMVATEATGYGELDYRARCLGSKGG